MKQPQGMKPSLPKLSAANTNVPSGFATAAVEVAVVVVVIAVVLVAVVVAESGSPHALNSGITNNIADKMENNIIRFFIKRSFFLAKFSSTPVFFFLSPPSHSILSNI
jgi:Flp pilus assembly pilin Flp